VLWSLLLGLGSIAEAQTPARVDGIVLDDETGAPVSKVVVLLDTGYVPEFRRYGAVTDRDGRFSVEAVKPSAWVIRRWAFSLYRRWDIEFIAIPHRRVPVSDWHSSTLARPWHGATSI
jgi:hypothetical protein